MIKTIYADAVSVRIGAHHLLDQVTLTVDGGEVVAIIGRNGAGKSTLLSVLSGDLRPSSGAVSFAGVAMERWQPRNLALRRAVVRQRSDLMADFTVAEVVALGASSSKAASRATVERNLVDVGLGQLGDRRVSALSGGERQRMYLARSLLQLGDRTDGALLLDEPTAALDPHCQHQVLTLVRTIARRGVAVVIVLHDLMLAARYADRVAVLAGGRLLDCAPPDQALHPTLLRDAFDIDFNLVRLTGESFAYPIACPARPSRII